MQPDAFIRANTHVDTAALVPELSLMLATHITPIWLASETALQQANVEPPFWAFAWPGGQALARFIIDQPEAVRGRRVLDFAAGCGLAGLAAKRAGAKHVEAAEIDPFSVAAIALNAALNGLDVTAVGDDLVGCACRWDLIHAATSATKRGWRGASYHGCSDLQNMLMCGSPIQAAPTFRRLACPRS